MEGAAQELLLAIEQQQEIRDATTAPNRVVQQMPVGLSQSEQDETWDEIEAALRQFEGPDGFVGPCELVVGAARR